MDKHLLTFGMAKRVFGPTASVSGSLGSGRGPGVITIQQWTPESAGRGHELRKSAVETVECRCRGWAMARAGCLALWRL
jgi:hypothetical protein